jgi:hypothetical protein
MTQDLINAPWHQSDDLIFNDKGVHVATVGNEVNLDDGTTTDDELCAWLSLIAAAPDLRHALDVAFKRSCERSESNAKWTAADQYVHETLRAAIAKAQPYIDWSTQPTQCG